MILIAKKPCSFGGKQFFIGDEIPASYVLDPKAQETMGVLVIVNSDAESGPTGAVCSQPIVLADPQMTICVHVDGNEMELEPTDDGLQNIFNVLIGRAEDAEAIINQMDDEDSLRLLQLADSRKTVKALAEARAKALQEEAGEA